MADVPLTSSGMQFSDFCVSLATSPVIVRSNAIETGLNQVASTVYSTSTATGASQYLYVYAYPVAVAWQAKDLSLISPQAAPEALSAGAKAGIGVGVVFGAVFIIAIVWMALWRRHQKRRAVTGGNAAFEKAELPGTEKPRAESSATELDKDNAVHEADVAMVLHESDGQNAAVEADSANVRAELDAGWRGWEAPSQKSLTKA